MSSISNSPLVPEPSNTPEQRLFLRKKVSVPLPIELLPGKEVWLDDVGEGGLCVSGSSRLEQGTNTFFSFQFPDANTMIEAHGVVAWSDNAGRVGIRFTRIKPDSTAALKRWLKSETKEAGTASDNGSSSSANSLQTPRAHKQIADLAEQIASDNLAGKDALELIVQRALLLTRAGGAAIALRQGNEVTCVASAGNAPDLGAVLNIHSGLTGECFRSGNIVSLTDSETDSRVSAAICRELNFRSVLIVPVSRQEELIGVIEALSPIPGNFDGGDILLLGSLAELIAAAYPGLRRNNG